MAAPRPLHHAHARCFGPPELSPTFSTSPPSRRSTPPDTTARTPDGRISARRPSRRTGSVRQRRRRRARRNIDGAFCAGVDFSALAVDTARTRAPAPPPRRHPTYRRRRPPSRPPARPSSLSRARASTRDHRASSRAFETIRRPSGAGPSVPIPHRVMIGEKTTTDHDSRILTHRSHDGWWMLTDSCRP